METECGEGSDAAEDKDQAVGRNLSASKRSEREEPELTSVSRASG